MNWTQKTVFFPLGKLTEEFIGTYLTRYSVDITGENQYIDGVLVVQSPVERDTILSTIHKDNYPLTRFRKASIFNGTIEPVPVYNPPLDEDGDTEGHELLGHTITLCWPETFISDIEREPQTEPELFSGVYIVE